MLQAGNRTVPEQLLVRARAVDLRGSRGGSLLPAIAQRQSIDALRRSKSFQGLECSLHTALGDLGVLDT